MTAERDLARPPAETPSVFFRLFNRRARARRSRWWNNPWLRRQAVALALNGIVLAIPLISLQHYRHWNVQAWWDFGPVKVFAIWALSFLPGWMFVRFLGQRAAALWWEFVLALHRLGADRPQYLPEPPPHSDYYAEWSEAGGRTYEGIGTIYQEKFDAYYGKSVSRIGAENNPVVRAETLFPVFLATAVLAVAWTAVLWDTSFATSPSGPDDALKFGFLGAYSFIIQMLMRRYFQSDLKASAYASAVLRVFVVTILVVVIHQLPALQNHPRDEAVVAYIVGFFPLVGMQALQKTAATVLRVAVPSLSPSYPLNQIDGLNVWYEARLLEEGIEDMQNLSTTNMVDVILHTHVPVGRLVDWVDQAHLFQHLDRTERGVLERSRVRRKAGGRKAGAVENDAHSREGSQMRHALRTLGIRTATDFLKLFPMSEEGVAARRRAAGGILTEKGLLALSTVLSQEPGLNMIWNWKAGSASRKQGA